MEKYCSKCGNEIKENEIFCSKCGNQINKGNTNQVLKNKVNNDIKNEVSIAGFICSLLGIITCGLTSLIGLILSVIGLQKSKKKGKKDGLALTGIVISAIIMGLWIFGIILVLVTSKPVIVEDFSTMSREEALDFCDKSVLNCTFSDEYSDTIPKGEYISQSIKAGEEIKSYRIVDIVYSKGIKEENEIEEKKNTSNEFTINLGSEEITILVGEKQTISYTLDPTDIEVTKVEWNTKNKKIVTVKNGEINGIKVGKTTITLKVNNKTKTIKVNVVEPKYEIEDTIANMSETYYQNEARGNSTYFGKKVKVSGNISLISVDESVLFNTGVTVHLDEDGARYDLLCNNENGIKGITKYSRGDNITVVGKMDTMVSSALVMHECEIYSE